jgi:hypothetical protein
MQARGTARPGIRNFSREAQKGRLVMMNPTQSAPLYPKTPAGEVKRSRQPEDRVYQAVTVAAMLMLLGSLWIF